MGSRLTSHEDSLLRLEHNMLTMNTAIQNTRSLSLGIQAEHIRTDTIITQHKRIIPRLSHEMKISSKRVNTVISSLEENVRESEDWMNEIKQSNINAEGLSNVIIEQIRQQVEELSQVVCTEWFATDDLRNEKTDFQDRFNATLQRSGASSLLPSSDPSLQASDREMNEMSFSKGCEF